jgi:hypothetical protein
LSTKWSEEWGSFHPRSIEALFGLVFEKMPNYLEILNGTPKLSLVFRLSSDFTPDKSQLVTPQLGFPNLSDTVRI